MCTKSPEVEDTSRVYEECTTVPTTNDFHLACYRWAVMTCVL
jgi:hypothetical protein